MSGCLHDDEGRDAVEAETPVVGVDVFRAVCRPRFGVEGAERFETAPVGVMIHLDGVRVRRCFAENDEGGVGAQLAGLRQIIGKGPSDGGDVGR